MKVKFVLFLALVLVGAAFWGCHSEGFVEVTLPTEIVYVYFSDPQYNMLMEDNSDIHLNDITAMQQSSLGPGIKVEIEDTTGNTYEMAFQNVSTPGSGRLTGNVEFYVKHENRRYLASEIKDVIVVWRNNLELCEFIYEGPRLSLKTSQGQEVFLDSLKILVMRKDSN